MDPVPDRALVLAFFPAETEERARPHAARIREALSLPETAAPRLVTTVPAIVVEAAPALAPDEGWPAARARLEAAPAALAEAFKAARLVTYVFLTASAAPDDGLPRTTLAEGEVVELAPDRAPGERLLIAGSAPERALDRVRPVLARVASARRLLEIARMYVTEILREKQVVDASINKVLRYRIGQTKGPEAIRVLEEHLQEMSQNYARLTRNAWIIDGAVADLRAEVEALEKESDALPRAAIASQGDAIGLLAAPIRAELGKIERQGRMVHESLETAKTAITTHSMNVEIVRSGELIDLQKSTEELQKKAGSFQSAAVLIELVVVFTYTLHSWESISGAQVFDEISAWFKFLLPLGFAVLLVLSAHEVAHRIKQGHFSRKARLFFAATVGVVVLMCAVTIRRGHAAHVEGPAAENHH